MFRQVDPGVIPSDRCLDFLRLELLVDACMNHPFRLLDVRSLASLPLVVNISPKRECPLLSVASHTSPFVLGCVRTRNACCAGRKLLRS